MKDQMLRLENADVTISFITMKSVLKITIKLIKNNSSLSMQCDVHNMETTFRA